MKTTVFAAAAAILLAAAPAFAADAYYTSPAMNLADQAPTSDNGSAQYPHFDGLAATPQSELMVRSHSGQEGEPESANSFASPISGN